MQGSSSGDYHGVVHIHHLALRTANVERLAAFYQDVIGLVLADGNELRAKSRWLMAGSSFVMIEPRGADEPDVAVGSMELTAFAIAPSERADAERRLARAGVVIEHRTSFTLYFRDPDGRSVGLSHYPQSPADEGERAPPATPHPR